MFVYIRPTWWILLIGSRKHIPPFFPETLAPHYLRIGEVFFCLKSAPSSLASTSLKPHFPKPKPYNTSKVAHQNNPCYSYILSGSLIADTTSLLMKHSPAHTFLAHKLTTTQNVIHLQPQRLHSHNAKGQSTTTSTKRQVKH